MNRAEEYKERWLQLEATRPKIVVTDKLVKSNQATFRASDHGTLVMVAGHLEMQLAPVEAIRLAEWMRDTFLV